MSQDLGGHRFEPIPVEAAPRLQPNEFERWENFDFDLWAKAVKQQLLAALHKES